MNLDDNIHSVTTEAKENFSKSSENISFTQVGKLF
jgi:hypothetical protein